MPTGHFIRTKEHKEKISKALKGKPKLWQRKLKIERVCKCGEKFFLTPGQVRPKHGKYCSRKCYFKYRIVFPVWKLSHKLKRRNHWNFKGDKAGYKAFHLRLNIARGKAKTCKQCNSKRFVEWANISGKYENMNDYKQLCRKCHNKFDDVANKGWTTRKKTSYEASTTFSTAEGGVVTA